MSPFRRRKSRASRARERRRQLVERERLSYRRERAGEGVEEAPAPETAPLPQEPAPPQPPHGRARRQRRGRPRLEGLRSATGSGISATAGQLEPGVGRALRSIGGALGRVLAVLLRLAALVERFLLAVFDRSHDAARGGLAFLERQATPQRVLVAVICAAAACLVYSQFVAFRAVEVGQAEYSAVSSVAPAPQTDRIDAGEAHAYVMIPLAALCVAIALGALISGRWRLGRLISAIGLAGIAISLAIDLPKGLDAGTAGESFAGASATLTEGFYAQLAASAVLALCGWSLATSERSRAGAARRLRRPRRRQPRPGREPWVAEGR
jgi:hypothetical protein